MTDAAAPFRELHLLGTETPPEVGRRAAFFANGALTLEIGPRARPGWWPSESVRAWQSAAARAEIVHTWTPRMAYSLAAYLATHCEHSHFNPTLIVHLDSAAELDEPLRAHFQLPEARVRFICNTESLANVLRRENVSPAHIGVVPECIPSLPVFGSKAEARAALELPATGFLVLIAPPLSLRAQAAVWGALVATKVYAQARVLLWGNGSDLNGLAQFVRCVGGESATTTLRDEAVWPAVVRTVDLGVHVAGPLGPRWGMLALVAAGVPLVVQDQVENRGMLRGDDEAFWVRSDATREIAGAVVRAVEEPQRLAKMGQAALTRLGPFEPERVRAAFAEQTRRLAAR